MTATSSASIWKTCSPKPRYESRGRRPLHVIRRKVMATDPNANGNSGSTDGNVSPAPATTTMLTFANPPQTSTAPDVATQCSQQGFTAVGITNLKPADVIDFSRFDQQSCIDLGDSIVLCVSSNG